MALVPMPLDFCPICGNRIKRGEAWIADGNDKIHQQDCWSYVAELRLRQRNGQDPLTAADAVVETTPERVVHTQTGVRWRVIDGQRR